MNFTYVQKKNHFDCSRFKRKKYFFKKRRRETSISLYINSLMQTILSQQSNENIKYYSNQTKKLSFNIFHPANFLKFIGG